MRRIFEKVLLRKTTPNNIKNSKDYIEYIKKLKIDYGYDTGGVQNLYCISKEGLIKYLKNSKIGRLSLEQRQALNGMLKYFGLNCINEKEYINTYEINEYIQDCIDVIIKENPNIEFKTCTTCGHTYPVHKNFFNVDNRGKGKLTNMCRICNRSKILHNNNKINMIYENFKLEGFKLFKEDIIEYYDKYIFKTDNKVPKELYIKENYLKLIKYYYDKGVVTKENIKKEYLEEIFDITLYKAQINIYEIYEHLFEENYKYYPWEYPNLIQRNLTFEDAKIIFNNYIRLNNIKIKNIFEIDYSQLLRKSRLMKRFGNNVLDFVVKYYNYQYAGYLFKTRSVNYYKDENNRIFDLKYLIEKDMKIPIEKIPLYLTKFSLQKKSRQLYELLRKGTYYKNLWEWVNKCYPNRFLEADFVINPYRDKFDSIEESQIDDILHSEFKNVIYNQRNNDRTINLAGKIPDWFIFTNNGCYLIEYFGLYVDRKNTSSNSRINDYRKRTDNKLEKYKELKGYKFIGLYPDDLKNDFEGVKNKIKNMN